MSNALSPSDAGEDAVPSMDPVAAQRWLARPCTQSPWLHDEVGQRMASRLQWFRQTPSSWLDWHPVRGGMAGHLAVRQHYPNIESFLPSPLDSVELSAMKNMAFDASNASTGVRAWWRRLTGSGLPQPLPAGKQVNLLWANMALHQIAQPMAALRTWHQRLATHGMLMFSCLGPDSLREVRQVYARQGWAEPSQSFTDMHDWGDMLVEVGFAEPVMDVETIVLSYASTERLLTDLRAWGRNLHPQRPGGLRGRAWLKQWHDVMLREMPRTPDGQMQLTFEVVYGHAFKPEPRARVAAQTAVSLQDMRQMLGARPPRTGLD